MPTRKEEVERIALLQGTLDHLHPKDAGYAAMAGSIDLSLFR
jgi:lysophospholipase L1-like esterase